MDWLHWTVMFYQRHVGKPPATMNELAENWFDIGNARPEGPLSGMRLLRLLKDRPDADVLLARAVETEAAPGGDAA
jgi:hypothetical protein